MRTGKYSRFLFSFDNPNQSIASGGLYLLIMRVSQGLSTFLINVMIGRIGGSALLGSAQSVISTASLASLFYAVPVSGALSRNLAIMKISNSYEEMAALSRFVAIRILLFSTLITVVVGTIASYYFSTPVDVIVVTAVFIFTLSFKAYSDSLHLGSSDNRRLAWLSSSVALASVAGVFVLLWMNFRSVWVLLPLIVCNGVFIILSSPPRTVQKVSPRLRKQIFAFVFLESIGTLGSTGFQQLSVLIATATAGLAYTGNLSVAFTLTAPLLLATGALSSVLFPALGVSHHQKDTLGLARRVNLATRVTTVFVVSTSILLIVLAPVIVDLIWGKSFESAGILTQVFAVITCLYAVAAPSVSYVTSESNKGMAFSALASVGGALLGGASWLFLLGIHPEIAIPLGLFISSVTTAMILYVKAWIGLQQKWGIQISLVIIFLAGAMMMSHISGLLFLNEFETLLLAIAWVSLWIIVRFTDTRVLYGRLKNTIFRIK